MVYDYLDKYTFLCDMYDEEADVIRALILNFFPFDNSVQVIDAGRGKNLLKRVQLPTLKLPMLQIGNIVNIFSKLLHIKDCAPATLRTLFNHVESTFALIKPVPASQHGKIITYIMQQGFRITQMKNGKLSKDFAMELYAHIAGSSMMPIIIDYVTAGEVIGLELVAPDAVSKWRKCLGATDPADAAPGTLRRLYGENKLKNAAHGCNTLEESRKVKQRKITTITDSEDGKMTELKLLCEWLDSHIHRHMLDKFFGYENGLAKIPFRATYKDCTCCVIKPHAVIDGNLGAILEQITLSGKFYVSAIAMFGVKLANAEEFYEIYKGVLQEYEAMCIQLAEGNCVALEVKAVDPKINVVCEFRKLCGPRDPDLCRQLYPDSIRAQYGKDILHNAVHCTDLPEDGELEVEYFFKLLVTD